jgi:NAD(P)-dependent dehydrogenase (short-subunit alcohol dehydrogenase family)
MSGHALVTGSNGGIGHAVCQRLHDDGWTVTGLDLTAADEPWHTLAADLAVPGSAHTAVAKCCEVSGPLTAIVHCAAIQQLGPAGSVETNVWHRTLQVNVVALDEMTAAAQDDLQAARGAVIAISSVHAAATTPGMAPYATSKAALNGWVRAAALDLAPGVRVNAIQPGAIRTPMLLEGFTRSGDETADVEQALDRLADRTPLGMVASPAEIAALVAVMLSDGFAFVTGTVITADGGVLARLSSE